MRKQGPNFQRRNKAAPFCLQGAQVLLDLVVSCNGDFAKAAEKVRMEEARFRRLLNQNLHVQHHMKIIKNFRVSGRTLSSTKCLAGTLCLL